MDGDFPFSSRQKSTPASHVSLEVFFLPPIADSCHASSPVGPRSSMFARKWLSSSFPRTSWFCQSCLLRADRTLLTPVEDPVMVLSPDIPGPFFLVSFFFLSAEAAWPLTISWTSTSLACPLQSKTHPTLRPPRVSRRVPLIFLFPHSDAQAVERPPLPPPLKFPVTAVNPHSH